jgi:Pregnancy-associated plasma protein-A/Fibronectin type III domain/Secretion system C-terminal sorting domain
MTKKLLISFYFLFLLPIALLAQRNCTAHEYHQNQLLNDANYRKVREQITKYTAEHESNFSAEARMSVTIPVIVHVIWRTNFPVENISDAQIISQIDVLNKDFRRLNADASNTPSAFAGIAADCNINFCLAKRTPQGTATNGINRVQANRTTAWGTNDAMKNPANGGVFPWDPSRYLNIYVCEIGGGILGYSPYPGVADANEGVVVDHNCFGTMGTVAPPYHLGRTATHEVGHWLNLNHIWGDSNCGNDEVNDTPVHQTSNSGCPAYPRYNTCSTASEMPMNYMDYSDDVCMNTFTNGQAARMQSLFAVGGARYSLLTSDACTPIVNTIACAAPVLNTPSTNITYASFAWNAVANGMSYTIEYKLASATTWTTISTTQTSYTLTNLAGGATYQLQIKANCTNSTSVASNQVTFSTSTVCPAPTNFAAQNITTNSATITWAISAFPSASYAINYRKVGTTTWTNVTTVSNTNLLQNLLANTSYEVEIKALCASNMSSGILKGTFTTKANTTISCGAPASVSATTITENSANMNWSAIVGASSYIVYYKTLTATTWQQISSTTAATTLKNLLPSTFYYIKINAVCSGVNSSDSPIVNFTTLAPTCNTVPTGLKTTSITTNSIVVAWTASTNAKAYRLQYKKTTDATWTVISNLTTPNYTIPNLATNTAYTIQVATVCQNNISSNFSTAINATTILAGCSDKYESNNTRSTAKVITIGANIAGNIEKNGDQDWFKFSNTSTEKYFQITISNIAADVQLRLYDSSGKLLAIASNLTATSKIIKYNGGKIGAYSIQIYATNGYFDATKCYDMKVTLGAVVFKTKNTKEDEATITADEDTFFEVNIAPNPIYNHATISIDTEAATLVHFEMSDLAGRTVKKDDFLIDGEHNNYSLEVGDMPNGVYILRFLHDNQMTVKKVIVQK